MSMTSRAQDVRENWEWMAVRGVLAILLGVTVLAWPEASLAVLVILFGSILLVDGITTLVFAASGGRTRSGNTWPLVTTGLVGIFAGVVTYVWPAATAGALLLIVAFWAIARGVLEIVAYVELRDTFGGSWLLAVSGVLALLFGIVLLVWPAVGLRLLSWIVGIYAILTGAVFITLAMRIGHTGQEDQPDMPASSPTHPGDPTPA